MNTRYLPLGAFACILVGGMGYASGRQGSSRLPWSLDQSASLDARRKEMAPAEFSAVMYGLQARLAMSGGTVDSKDKVPASEVGALPEAIGDALDKPEGYRAAYQDVFMDYLPKTTSSEDSTARLTAAAAQASVQLQVIQIEQNRKIIALLQQIAKK